MKTALVTGGASGIGYEIVKNLIPQMKIVLVDCDAKALDKVSQKFGNKVEYACLDVSKESDVLSLFEKVRAKCGRVDALINNAGISEKVNFLNMNMAQWNRVIATNLTGVFLMCRSFANQKRDGTAIDQIVNIASVSGLVGMPNYAAYNVSKAGVIELTKTLAVELAPQVQTCAICPGYILTPMQVAEYSAQDLDRCAQQNPSKRLGRPNEVSELVAFLLSGKSNYFNGSVIVMDGGETAGGLAS